eukprot:s2586_g5.t1
MPARDKTCRNYFGQGALGHGRDHVFWHAKSCANCCSYVQLSNLMQFLDAASFLVVLDREQCLGDTQIGSPCRAIGREFGF